MTIFRNISAVIFDMDGTLIDSEIFTEHAINALCRDHGVSDVDSDYSHLYGVSWQGVAAQLRESYPRLPDPGTIAAQLDDIYHQMLLNEPPEPIYQSRSAVVAARRQVPTAIVSSSGRASIMQTITRMDIGEHIDFFAGAEDCDNPKPAPDAYMNAARALRVPTEECLVFEDSIVGIQAAKAAGMNVVAITHRSSDIRLARSLSDHAVTDFSELGDDFFPTIVSRLELD